MRRDRSWDEYNSRNSPEYKKFCKEVYTRDNYRCVVCGKSGRINAHHLDGWNWFPAGRFDKNNAVTLCAGKNGCHNIFHEIYGRGNNTRGQFYQFKDRFKNLKRKKK